MYSVYSILKSLLYKTVSNTYAKYYTSATKAQVLVL